MNLSQTTSHILMVRPANFCFNAETAANNAFQNQLDLGHTSINAQAVSEFNHFVEALTERGIHVLVIEDTPEPIKPDAIFPNNWFSTHADGTFFSYPMFAVNRRFERDEKIIQIIENQYSINKKIHLEHYESVGLFLEGTGSMVIDRVNEIVYACISERTNITVLDAFCDAMDYKRIAFKAVDENDKNIYHTNVMMALGESFVIICFDAIPDEKDRLTLIKSFDVTDKEIIEISYQQMLKFAGNMLQVRNKAGETFLVMSEQAYYSLDPAQINHIQRHTQIIFSNLKTIETFGGGSARCMMAEIFLEKK